MLHVTDGVGAPDTNPIHLEQIGVSTIMWIILHFPKLAIWGSSWGVGASDLIGQDGASGRPHTPARVGGGRS